MGKGKYNQRWLYCTQDILWDESEGLVTMSHSSKIDKFVDSFNSAPKIIKVNWLSKFSWQGDW